MNNLAISEVTEFRVIQEQPAWMQLGNLVVAQILIGDPGFGSYGQHMVEDHVLQFLHEQSGRDPSQLVAIIESHIGKALTQKQQVLMSMVLDDYFGAPSGFYERVLNDVPRERLEALAHTIGLNQVIEALIT